MSNLKVPYEISLWEERLVAVDASGNEYDDFIDTSITVDHQYYKEKKICIIGSHTMETPIAAVDPVLVQKVDGTSTLTFSIYSKYYDEASGKLLDNPFVKYLTNERKVKLKYFPKNDDQAEWLDLVIKKISETSENYKFSYTATDSFINELSKTGYNLVFDAELNNNTGSVNDLAMAILEGTDWAVDKTAGQLQETIEEPLYELVLTKDITAWKIEDTSQTKNITIKAGSKIYPFYSCVKNSTADFYQFIYLNGADPLVDQDGILRNEGCQYFIKTIPSGTATYFNEYRAERYARTVKIKYEKELERYVQGYTSRDSNDIWGYVENETISPTITKNYLVNSENIISTKGWIYNYPGLVGIETFPTVKNVPAASARLHVLKTATVDNKNVSDNGKAQALINSGLVSNAYDIKKIVAGDKYVFRLKVGNDWNKSISAPALIGTDSAMKFKVFIGKKKVTKGSDNIPTKTILEDDGALGAGNWGVSLANATQLSDGSYYTVVTFQKSYDEEELKKLYLSLKLSDINDKTQYYIEFVQFFPYTEFVDSNIRFMPLPNLEMVRLEDYSIHNFSDLYVKLEPVYYFYYYDKNGNKIERSAKNTSGYAPIYVPNYGKVRSITAKESNRFNLLQDLSESFECWCKFTIEHEENGAIKLGDKHKPLKKVSFHAQVGQKKNIGFVYGKNLKSISRTLDSDSIASKLIVKSNANKLAESGSCNIARAAQNPSGENFVYDFSHYIKQGLLNKYNVYNDLYDDNASKGYVGLFPQLKQKNLERDKLIQQSAILAGDYSEYKAQANADELLLEKSRDILFDLETEFVEKTGKSFDALENNDPLLEKEEFLGIATSISLYRQQVEDLEQKINGNSGSKKRLEEIESELKTLSGQLSNIEAETSDLIHKFENKYSRFIQEASWTSEDYIDDNLYYIDAESTLHESAQPKVTYTINVVDLSQLDEYKPYRFKLGDITYVQDTDFFGWHLVDGVKTPYKEEIVVTELTTNFHEPDKATIKVRNYKNQFEDLFQRLTASTQQLKFHSGEYDRSADVVNGKGMVQPGALQEAFNNNAYVISNINNQSVEMGEQGIIIRNTRAPNEIVRLASGGIFLTEDGGETWTTGITASGINAKVITTGTLNAALANITTGNGGGGVFIDENGITGKDSDRNERFRLSNAGEFKVGSENSYIKFDKNGLTVKGQIEADGGSLNINNNFIVDTSGNVELNGNITWGTGASPTQVVYASYKENGTTPTRPTNGTSYSRFDLVATTAGQWHRQFDSANDRFGSYTYDGGKTWGEVIVIQGRDGSNGTSTRTLVLDNEFDSLVKTSTGQWISKTSTVVINAYQGSTRQGLYYADNPINIIPPSDDWIKGDNYSLAYSGGTVTFKIKDPPSGFSGGEFSIQWKNGDTIYATKKFNLQVITSLVDYDLILASTNINNTNTSGTVKIPIKVLKKTKDGTVVLEAKGSEPIDIYRDGTKLTNWEVGYSIDTVNDKVIELKSTDGSIIWDKQTISFVKNGSNGSNGGKGDKGDKGDTIQVKQAFYRSNSATPPSTKPDGSTYPTGWTKTASGVTSSQKYEYISQCTVTNSNYGTWSSPVLFARYGSDGAPGSAATVNAINVFNALTSDGTKFGCFGEENGALYINANYINTGILRVGNVGSEIFFADINNKLVEIGSWNVGTIPNGKHWGGSSDDTYSGSLYNAATIGSNDYLAFLRIAGSDTGHVFAIRTKAKGATSGATTKFSVARNGDLYAANADITGKITTKEGTIGGWTITAGSLKYGGDLGSAGSLHLCPAGNNVAVKIGNSPSQKGWSIAVGNTFGITNAGKLYATGADISGVITATGGDIGGLKINQSTPLSLIKTVRHSVNSSTAGTNYIKISNWNSTSAWYNYYYKILPGESLTLKLSYSGTEVYTLSSLPTGNSMNFKRFDYQNLAAGTHTYSVGTDKAISYLLINQSGSTAPTVSYSSSKSPLILTGSGAITEQTVMVSFTHNNTSGGGSGSGSVTPEMSFDFSSYGPIEVVSTYPAATDDTASISTSTSGKKITVTSAGHFGSSGSTGAISLKVYLKYSYNMPSNSTLWSVNSDGSTEIKYLKVGTLINSQLEDLEKRVKALEAK